MAPRPAAQMPRKAPDQSQDIMARLNATGLLPSLAAAKGTPRGAGRPRGTGTGGRRTRGMLTSKTTDRRFMMYGRRAMSPYQARALGSGEGVLAPRDASFMQGPPQQWRSPQDWRIGWGRSFDGSTGRSTIQGV